MLGSKNRDYKTSDRRISKNLKSHFDRMQSLIREGLSKEEASKKALEEMVGKKK
jgi:hypothetical protein